MGRKFTLHGSTVGWRAGWPEMGEIASAAGYQGVVLPREGWQSPAPAPCGIAVTAMAVPVEIRRDEETYRAGLRDLDRAVEFGASVGCKVAVVGLPPSSELPKPEQKALYRRRLEPCLEPFAKHGVRLAVEAISPVHLRRAKPYEFIWRMDEMLDFVRDVSAEAGLVADCWHWHHAGETAEDLLALGRAAFLDVHISDAPDIPAEDIRDMERVLPGEGIIDFDSFFGALDRMGYDGAVSVEVFGSRLAGESALAAARLALEAARRRVPPRSQI
jgi:sugar phosphate isomerase/epimerase